jgi:hypothetical protein
MPWALQECVMCWSCSAQTLTACELAACRGMRAACVQYASRLCSGCRALPAFWVCACWRGAFAMQCMLCLTSWHVGDCISAGVGAVSLWQAPKRGCTAADVVAFTGVLVAAAHAAAAVLGDRRLGQEACEVLPAALLRSHLLLGPCCHPSSIKRGVLPCVTA